MLSFFLYFSRFSVLLTQQAKFEYSVGKHWKTTYLGFLIYFHFTQSVFPLWFSLGCFFIGGYQLLRPLGASHPRVASIGNETGPAIMEKLKEKVCANDGFRHLHHARALRLMMKDGRVQGALAWNKETKSFLAISAGCVLLANGGFGQPPARASAIPVAYIPLGRPANVRLHPFPDTGWQAFSPQTLSSYQEPQTPTSTTPHPAHRKKSPWIRLQSNLCQ